MKVVPDFNKLYKKGLETKELRALIIKEYEINKDRADKMRLEIFSKLREHLSENFADKITLKQDIKPRKNNSLSNSYNLFNDYLKRLEKNGWIVRNNGCCSLSESNKYVFNSIFKTQDFKLIQGCPVNCIYSKAFSYDKDKTGRTIAAKCISIYGLDKRHVQIDEILDPAFKKLRRYVDNIYYEKLCNIIIDESKKIKNDKLMKTVEEWHSQIKKINFLYTPRFRNEISSVPVEFKFAPHENLEKEFKEITERIWNRFNKECPPIGIMIRL